MNKLLVRVVLLAGLAGLPLLANADRDDYRGLDWSRVDSLQWRLQGREIYVRAPGERQWRRAPGEARVVSNGWAIGTDRRSGGYGIYRWNGRDWRRVTGAAIDIGGSYSNPWVINDRGERFVWTGNGWREDSRYGRGGRDERDFQPPRRDDRRDQDRDRRDRERDSRYRR